MAGKKLVLSEYRIKAFVMGLTDFEKLTDGIPDIGAYKLVQDGTGYQARLDDILAALTYFEANDTDYQMVCNDWFKHLYWYLGDLIGLPKMVGEKKNSVKTLDLGQYRREIFFENDTDLARWTMSRLINMCDEQWSTEDRQALCSRTIREILEVADHYKTNQGKPHDEWILTDSQKEDFVAAYADKDLLAKQDAFTQDLYKKILNELAAEGNVNALQELGYAHYGNDNPMFGCDWEKSKDCMLKLMETGDDAAKAMAANTLGYIYYYGRCNGGEPQYEDAYRYFSLAAFYGYYEALYKVADMLKDGRGTFRNEEAAFRLYQWVYTENYKIFPADSDCSLSDAALRMAGCYQHGVGIERNLLAAYHYYLIADTAMRERKKVSDFFGLDKVSAAITAGLDEVRAELGKEVQQKCVCIDLAYLLENALWDENAGACHVKIVKRKHGYNITIKRATGTLLCLEEISYCRKTNQFRFFIPKKQMKKNRSKGKNVRIDRIRIKKGKVRFYHKKKLIFSVTAEPWIMKAKKG